MLRSNAFGALVIAAAGMLTTGCNESRGAPARKHEYRAEAKLWDVETLKTRDLFRIGPVAYDPGDYGTIRAVAFSPDGKLVATGGGSETSCVWSVETGKSVFAFGATKGLAPVQAVRFRTNGELVVANRGSVWLVDVAERQATAQFKHECRLVRLSPDGIQVAGDEFERAGDLAIYKVAGGEKVAVLDTTRNRYLAFNPDGSKLMSVTYNFGEPYTVKVRDVGARKVLKSRNCRDPLAWSPDGTTLAVQSEKPEQIELWGWETGAIATFDHGHDYLTALAFSPDGKLLASAGWNPKPYTFHIKLWDVKARKLLRSAESGEVRVNAIAFAPDGRTLATTGAIAREVADDE